MTSAASEALHFTAVLKVEDRAHQATLLKFGLSSQVIEVSSRDLWSARRAWFCWAGGVPLDQPLSSGYIEGAVLPSWDCLRLQDIWMIPWGSGNNY